MDGRNKGAGRPGRCQEDDMFSCQGGSSAGHVLSIHHCPSTSQTFCGDIHDSAYVILSSSMGNIWCQEDGMFLNTCSSSIGQQPDSWPMVKRMTSGPAPNLYKKKVWAIDCPMNHKELRTSFVFSCCQCMLLSGGSSYYRYIRATWGQGRSISAAKRTPSAVLFLSPVIKANDISS